MSVFDFSQLWRFALLAIPMAILVAVICRCLPCKPSTRHSLWLTLLVLIAILPFLPSAPAPDLMHVAGTLAADPDQHPKPTSSAPALTEDDATPRDAEASTATTERSGGAMKTQAPDAPTLGIEPDADHAGADESRTAGSAVASQPRMMRVPAAGSAPVAEPRRQRTWDPPTGRGEARDAGWSAPAPPAPTGIKLAPPPRVEPAPVVMDTERDRVAAEEPAPFVMRRSVEETEAETSTDDVEASSPGAVTWAQWVGRAKELRDIVMSVPPIPTLIWSGGAAALLLVLLVRIVLFRRRLASAVPAPPELTACVEASSRRLGLAAAPQVAMIDARISPMVWCGRRARLLVPRSLWMQLDDAGREAVIVHELAHLKRRDHWVCWLVMLISVIYWWHPVVWWIRRQLREEADLCCDVWVTTLMPKARRAYATALLETKRFTSCSHQGVPAIALGVTTVHAKRLARRLTMVMSHQITPRISLRGVALVGVMAIGAWLVSPTFAGPPTKAEQEAKAAKEAYAAGLAALAEGKAKKAEGEAAAACAETAKCAEAAACAGTASCGTDCTTSCGVARPLVIAPSGAAGGTYISFGAHGDDMPLEERLAMLEAKLEHLMRALEMQLAPMMEQSEHMEHLHKAMEMHPEMLEHIEVIQRQVQEQFEHLPEMMNEEQIQRYIDAAHAHALEAIEHLDYEELAGHIEAMYGDGGYVPFAAAPAPAGDIVQKRYELPEGKLEAMFELMARQDVQVLVSPDEGGIVVHGTMPQHMVFQAFCDVINGESDAVEFYEVPEGQREALTELLIRDDVPLRIRPDDNGIEVHGSTIEQTIFKAFLDMINGGMGPVPNMPAMRAPAPPAPPAVPHLEHVQKQHEHMRHAMAEYEQHMKHMHVQKIETERELQAHMHEYEMLLQRAEQMFEHADAIQDKADELNDRAEDAEGEMRIDLVHKANRLMMEAMEVANEARLHEAKASIMERMIDELEERLMHLEDGIDDLEDELEDLEDEFDEFEYEEDED
jgi:beta-lactamase regulating signal transducer with metallopeptidase domain